MKCSIALLLALGGLLGGGNRTEAQDNWWRLGGQQGVAWESVVDFNLLIDHTATPGAIQPWELKPDQNVLPLLGPWQRWRFPTDPQFRSGNPRFWTDINHNSIYESTETWLFVDGDPTTYVERRDWRGVFYTMDMGAQLPVDRFVFYPPDGVSPESDEPFTPNYILKSYSLTGAKDESGILQDELERGFQWRGEGPCCSLGVSLGQDQRNGDPITEVNFPLQNLRFVRLIAVPDGFTLYGSPIVTRSAFAEMELYGRGFVPRASWESQVIDLGREVNFGRVVFGVSKWRRDGEDLVQLEGGAPKASVEIRTGRDDSPTAYFGFNDLGGHVEVTKKEWDRLTALETRGATVAVGARGPSSEDQENWSFWSLPIEESGVSPRMPWGRYIQLRLQLQTDDFWEYARVESLWVEIAPLLADRVVGEVVTVEELQPQGGRVKVEAGERTEFVYEVGAEFSGGDRTGFDALRVLTPAEGAFKRLEMGDPLGVVEPDSVVAEENGFTVYLPSKIEPGGLERLRIVLDAVLYSEAGEFGGEVFERSEQNLLQIVEGGDVSDEVGSNQLLIVASAASTKGILDELEVQPRAFTPQGDGINDRLQIGYTLFRVQQGAQVAVEIFTLGGVLMRRVELGTQQAGSYQVEWDGRDEHGQLVSGGLYLAQVKVDTDKGSVARMRPIAVAY